MHGSNNNSILYNHNILSVETMQLSQQKHYYNVIIQHCMHACMHDIVLFNNIILLHQCSCYKSTSVGACINLNNLYYIDVTAYYILSPSQQKIIRPTDEVISYDVKYYDENYDENAVKTVSKCLACMKACWGPEFEPSVEEIMHGLSMRYGDSLSSLSLVSSHSGGFPYSV